MNDTNNNNNSASPDGGAAAAVKKTSGESGFSPIWIVPIVALLIGIFLIYRVVTESGPTITITFAEAPGMEAGKTKVKYKDVIVGEVTKVDISDDIKSVIVSVEMDPSTKEYLTDESRFWVVRPQISGGNISGLGTLLSGNYIGMDPCPDGKKEKHFIGLERPPVVQSTEAGSRFKLRAKRLSGVDFGSPVFYKDISVGQVIDYTLQDDGNLGLELFVRAPYDKHVNNATRFWNASGFDVTLSANGLEINTESLVSIIAGGIAFDTMAHLGRDASKPAATDRVFNLYPSRARSRQPTYHEKQRVLLYFTDSVRGLTPGAPVEMRGYQVGEVIDVDMEFNRETNKFRLPVLIELEPERVTASGDETFRNTITALVERGLRGQLRMGNLVLGKLLVELDFHPNAAPATVDFTGKYPVMPTMESTFAAITENAGALVAELRQTGKTINALLESDDFNTGMKDLAATMGNVKRLTAELEQTSAPELAKVLVEANATLAEAQSMLATNSTTRTEINRLLAELAQAARSIRLLADYLEQHPESIIKGKD
ncbi:MAG: MlaD family protein [Halieaceae bacterium]